MPKMTHPDSELEIEANDDQVEMYASQGWEASPKAKPSKDGDDK